jgi:hypothetical protein
MKTLVIIATHHGAFLTIKSALNNSSHDKLIVLVPRSQVDKYNKMYVENISKSQEFEIFKDYDKLVTKFCKTEVFVVDDWDMNNTVSTTVETLMTLQSKGKHFVVNAGMLILTDPFTDELVNKLDEKRVIIGKTRVYGEDRRLNMYHMIGMPREEPGYDANVFAVNVDLFDEIARTDTKLIQDSIFHKKLEKLPRGFNMKHDPLIGTAISARETIMHNVRSVQASVVNFWMPSIKKYEDLYPEETFGYPFDVYLDYATQVKKYLPVSTFERIRLNGEATKYWIKDIRDNILS